MGWMRVLLKPPILTTSLILVFVLVIALHRTSQRDLKLDGFQTEPGGKYAIVASLDFQPEAFHMTRLQQTGRLMRVDETNVYLRDVSTGDLLALASKPWISSINSWDPEQGDASE
ncbi:hypothetical protein [Pararhizobium sp. IMCC21322]|uniref:hypothetical protein n=1 Tax=Pararhizobium sp. IMCC21322 TaxID=3067903 RepID=UPI00274039EE|nr:hypothetical protein [Pararhizobium sp. IMCC21322]